MKREKAQRHSLKIIAIFFAVSLWFYVLNSEPIQVERKLSVNYIVPKGYAMASLNEKEVTVKLKGSKAFLQNIFSNKEKINIDLNPYFLSSGKNFKVRFYTSDVSVPFGVEVVDIVPKETSIDLDQKVSEVLPVRVQYIGDAPQNRKIKERTILPQNLIIEGPALIIRNVSWVDTAPVNLALFSKDEGVLMVPASDLDPRLKYKELSVIKIKYKTQLLTNKH